MANSQEIRSINFVERAKARINGMKQAAAELTEELGLPPEAKYDVLSEIYDQGLILSGVADNAKRDEEAKPSLRQPLPSDPFNKESEARLAKEEEWVQRASQGDAIALTKIYEHYIDDIYRYCYSQAGNISEAENLTSETFTRALEALSHKHFTWQGKPLGAWLYGIAANVVREYSRKSMNASIIEELDHLLVSNEPVGELPDILETFIQQEKQGAIWQLIKEFPVEEQRILVLRHGYELSYAEIAERLGRTENACKQMHYRILKKLKLKAQETDLWSEVSRDESET